jgi:hypothetical protein
MCQVENLQSNPKILILIPFITPTALLSHFMCTVLPLKCNHIRIKTL